MKILFVVILPLEIIMISSVHAYDEWRDYCFINKNLDESDSELRSEMPPPQDERVKFVASSIVSSESHVWHSVCNVSDYYLSFRWDIVGLSAPTSNPLDPIDGKENCKCERQTIGDRNIEISYDQPLYYTNTSNFKSTDVHIINHREEKFGSFPGDLETAIANLGKERVRVIFEFTSVYRDGEITNYFYHDESVASLVFGAGFNFSLEKVFPGYTALPEVGGTGISASISSESLEGLIEADNEPYIVIEFTDPEKSELSYSSERINVESIPMILFDKDGVALATLKASAYLP